MKTAEVRLSKGELLLLIDYLGVIEDAEDARFAVEEKYKWLDVRELRGHLQNAYELIDR